METLYGRLQVADSSNQYNPYKPGHVIMDHPCMSDGANRCISRVNMHPGRHDQWVDNPPPEDSEYIQKINDHDVRGRGMGGHHETQPVYRDTIGTGPSDISRGQMLLPSAYDMPIVRKTAFFDTRYRDVTVNPDAGRVLFELEAPLMSVSRISLVTTRVPIRLTENAGLQLGDYVTLSIGINLQDRVTVTNRPDATVVPPPLPSDTMMGRALAIVPLIPVVAGSTSALLNALVPPYQYYADFMKPIPSLERLELSWHRFIKTSTGGPVTDYIMTPAVIPPGESIYDVDKNAYVMLSFYCKNRRPE
jgi:hypothetical protein